MFYTVIIFISYSNISSSGGELMEPEILHGEFDTLLLDNSSGQEGRKRRKTVFLFLFKYLLFKIKVSLVVTMHCCNYLLCSIQKMIHRLHN